MSQYGNIGQLNIQISANSDAAAAGLERLSNVINSLTFGDTVGLEKFVKELRKLSKIDLTGFNIGNVIGQLQSLNGLNINVSGIAEFSKTLRSLSSKSVDTALQRIPLLSDAMKKLMADMSEMPVIKQNTIDAVKALTEFSSQGGKIKSASKAIAKGLGEAETQAKKTTSAFHKLISASHLVTDLAVIGIARMASAITRALREAGREGIEYASSLVETQNIIERTFGNNINIADAFSKSALRNYGMNELESKKMLGIFQAMGVALGENKDRMAEVSASLGALVGDYASFFNKNVGDVADDFTSVFTGLTKAMRKYGIDFTNATLQEFADANGWDVQVKSLDQYTKSILRYNYLISRSKDIMGDFQRTQMSYANQIKILRQQLTALFGSIGQIATSFLQPILNVLNTIISKIRQFVAALVKVLGLLGVTFKGGASDAASGVDDMSESIGNSGGAADKAAKKMKNYTTSIDELNVLKPDDSGGGGGGGGGGLDFSGLELDWDTDWFKLDEYQEDLEKFEKVIRDILDIMQPTFDALNRFKDSVLVPIGKIAFDNLKTFYHDFLVPLGKWTFGDALPFLFNTLADIGEKIHWDVINDGIKNLIQALGKATLGIGKGLLDFFKSIAPLLKPIIATIINKIADAFKLLTTTLNKIPISAWEAVGRAIGVWLTYKAVAGIVNGIANAIKGLGNMLMNIGSNPTMMKWLPNLADGAWKAGDAISEFGSKVAGLAATIGIIGAVAMAFYQLINFCKQLEQQKVDKQLQEIGTSFEQIDQCTQKVKGLKDEWNNWKNGLSDTQLQAQYIQDIADKYNELAKKANLTNEEQRLLNYYTGELIKVAPELEGHIDDATGKFDLTADAIQKVIDKQIELAKSEALKEFVKQTELAALEAEANYKKVLQAEEKAVKEGAFNEKQEIAIRNGYKAIREEARQTAEDSRSIANDAISKYTQTMTKGYKKAGEESGENFTEGTAEAIEKGSEKTASKAEEKGKETGEKFKEGVKEGLHEEDTNLDIEVGTKTKDGAVEATTSEIKKTIDEIPEEDRAEYKVKTDADEESIQGTKEKINTAIKEENAELDKDENKVKAKTDVDTEGLDAGFQEVNAKIDEENVLLTKKMATMGTQAMTSLNTALLDGQKELTRVVTENATVIKTKFEQTLEITGSKSMLFNRYGQAVITGFTNGINNNKQTAIDSITLWATNIRKTFESYDTGLGIKGNISVRFEKYAHNVVTGFTQGIDTNKQTSLQAIRTWATEIKNTFTADINAQNWEEFAHQINLGFASGINKWGNIAKQAVKSWAAKIMAAFMSEMDINSPSKVFESYGKYTVQGLNLGIKENMESTTNLISKWTNDIMTQMQTLENFKVDLSSTIQGLDSLDAKINTRVDMSGFYSELEKAQTMGMNTSLNSYAQNQQSIQVEIPNITLEVDSREIARANYKGQKQLGYSIKK